MTEPVSTSAPPAPWTTEDSAELYRVDAWGKGYFAVDDGGRLAVRPQKEVASQADLLEIVEGLEARGFTPPLLLRFPDLLSHRLGEIAGAFTNAMTDNGYRGGYTAVFPIKVNQQRPVVEEVFRFGRPHGFGLEVGSKPELLAALALTKDEPDRPVICNGFKDDEYIEGVVLAKKLGRNIIPVVEAFRELLLVAKHAERYGVEPRVGIRVKLASTGAGRWSHSAGARSKFGLTVEEVLEALEFLEDRGLAKSLELLHCHMGSQINDIRNIKEGVDELAHVYAELVRLGAGLQFLDVGGGLGVDYDGSQSAFESSINYSLEEYAGDVVYRVMNVCDNAGIDHPTIVTECGRAMIAYHSVLVFDVLGVNRREESSLPPDVGDTLDEEDPQPLFDLLEAYRAVTSRSLVESFHDARHALREILHLFKLGYASLPHRALAERLYWATCTRIRELARELEELPDELPEELEELEDELRDTYFCNFSVFQSVPDSWALRQIFPVMPIHRLDEEPTRHAVLGDITCDSDGKIDRFLEWRDTKRTLELHELREDESYYLGVFLVGAYQETLGDLHNLFGDTHVVHVEIDPDGRWSLGGVVEGDTVRDVLGYVQYDPGSLLDAMRLDCEGAVAAGRLTVGESRSLLAFYRRGLDGYTYLEPEEE